MYFLPRHSSFYARVAHIKPLYRYTITLGTLAIMSIGWFFINTSLIDVHIQQKQAEIKKLQEQVLLMQQTDKNVIQLQQSIKALRSQFKTLATKYQSGEYVQTAIMSIIHQAGSCKLAMQECSINDQKDEGWYVQHMIRLDISGSYDQLLKFTQALASPQYLIAIQQAQITYTNNDIYNLKCGLDLLAVK